MKKLGFLLIAFVLSATFSTVSAKKKAEEPALKTRLDSVSYALGINIGGGIKQQLKELPGQEPNAEILLKAIAQAYNGDTVLLIKSAETGQILEKYFTEEQQKEGNKNKDAGIAFLEQNKKRPGVMTTPSGLQYEILVKGTGASPSATDKVKVNYRGTLIDGKEFDSSYARNEPAVFGVNQVISGWTEALQMMTEGSKWKIYLPYELAYGERAAGADIKPYSALIFEVELIEIVK